MSRDIMLYYTEADSLKAHAEWKAACGHHSIAAACEVNLEAVRRACPKLCGWMSPTMVSQTLRNLGRDAQVRTCPRSRELPPGGERGMILRIQFEGSWLNEGVPARVAYFHTHYVAVLGRDLVLDTLFYADLFLRFHDWAPWLGEYCVSEMPRTTGWHFTHVWFP